MRDRGFTLVELMITLAVAAILLAIAVPSFRTFVQNTRLTTQADTLVYSLNLARNEAVKLDTPVAVCASSDGATCSGAWVNGWIVCYPVANCLPGAATAPTVLQVAPGLSNANTVVEKISGAPAPGVTYLSNGQTGTGYQFVFCDSRGPAAGRDVEINLIGRIEAAATAGQQVSGAALGAC